MKRLTLVFSLVTILQVTPAVSGSICSKWFYQFYARQNSSAAFATSDGLPFTGDAPRYDKTVVCAGGRGRFLRDAKVNAMRRCVGFAKFKHVINRCNIVAWHV